MTLSLDEALSRLHDTAPTFSVEGLAGLTNHGPMAVEALSALGRPLDHFMETYVSKLEAAPRPGALKGSDWLSLRGDEDAYPELVTLFTQAIEGDGVARVATDTLPSLLDGWVSAAYHGALRTMHALRGWSNADTAPRRAEVAHALAYWASNYHPLVVEGAGDIPTRTVDQTLAAVTPVADAPRSGGLIVDRFAGVDVHAPLQSALRRFDADAASFEQGAAAIAKFAAGRMLEGQRGRFVYLHTVTSSAALLWLGRHLSEANRRRALIAAVTAAAAVDAVTRGSATPPPDSHPSKQSIDAYIDAAATGEDDHDIKLSEALRRLSAAAPDPVWAALAADSLRRIV